jgi:hypothetical protein
MARLSFNAALPVLIALEPVTATVTCIVYARPAGVVRVALLVMSSVYVMSFMRTVFSRPGQAGVHESAAKTGRDGKARLCSKCQIFQAEQTNHCMICAVCVPMHDHHCPFTGCCIGQHNRKFFMLSSFYLALHGASVLTTAVLSWTRGFTRWPSTTLPR